MFKGRKIIISKNKVYDYFTGLSITTDKYHVMICNEHLEDFSVYSEKWRIQRKLDKNKQYKIDCDVEIQKIINIIKIL